MLDCILNTIGSTNRRSGINDLMKINAPTPRTLEKFQIEWKNTAIEAELDYNMRT